MAYFDDKEKQYHQRLIDNPPIHVKLEIDRLIKTIPVMNGDIVVDFGAGTGRLSIPLLKAGYQVKAVDISKESLKSLKTTANKLRLVISTAKELMPAKMIVGADVLHHLNLEKYAQVIYDRLLPGGEIAFSEPNGLNFFWYLLIWLKLDWNEEKGIRQIRINNVKSVLSRAGFTDIKITGLGVVPGPLCFGIEKLCRLNYWMGNIPGLRNFAYRLIITARKN